MTMAEQMQPMPDVTKRCPKCGAPHRGDLSRAHSYYCDSWVEPETGTDTEDERWRKKYEALRAGVEQVLQHLYERTRATSRDWYQSRHPYHDGAYDAYCEAFLKVRRVLVLDETGGGDQHE